MSDSVPNSDDETKVKYAPCSKEDIIIHNILYALSGCTFKSSINIFKKVKKLLKEISYFEISKESHEEILILMNKNLKS